MGIIDDNLAEEQATDPRHPAREKNIAWLTVNMAVMQQTEIDAHSWEGL